MESESKKVQPHVNNMERLRQRTKRMEEAIKPNALLPKSLQVPTAGTHFYKYGLIFFSDPEIERKLHYNPYFILFMEMLYFTRSFVSLMNHESKRQYFVYAGDYMYFIRAKVSVLPVCDFNF